MVVQEFKGRQDLAQVLLCFFEDLLCMLEAGASQVGDMN